VHWWWAGHGNGYREIMYLSGVSEFDSTHFGQTWKDGVEPCGKISW
jgi:hypothetical protein